MSVPLTVDFGDARPERPFPVRGGVPFSCGVLNSVDHLRLFAEDDERECQVACTAVWPDGSVKWALVDCFALPGENLRLEYGPEVIRQPVHAALVMVQDDEGVHMDTGVLQLRIRRDGSGFLDEVLFSGKKVVSRDGDARRHVLDFVHVNRTEDRPSNTVAVCGQSDPSEIKITALDVEENGPLHGVILVRGVFRHRAAGTTIAGIERPTGCPFTLRVHCWQGTGLLGVEHFFHYEGDPDVDFIRQVGVGFATSLAQGHRIVSWGSEDASVQSLNDGVDMVGLHQASPDHYHVEVARNGGMATTHTGRRAAGWLDVSDASGGVAFGIRAFWPQYEKSLHVDRATGRIDAWLWPPEAQTLDMRRYARAWGVGEDGAYEGGPLPINYRLAAKGAGKSHELLFYFHEGNAQAADVSQIFRAFDVRPLLMASPVHYAQTRALGYYQAMEEASFADLEHVIQRPIDYLMAAREKFRWYGFFDYGDVQTCYATFHKHDRWESDFGRWGWGNGDQIGRLSFALMLQFIRTGDRMNFAFAEANMRHVHDVDATHTKVYPFKFGEEFRDLSGSTHRHNAQHWACPYVGSRGSHPMGARIHYFLTGSGRSKDILDEILALAERIPDGAARDGHGASAISFLCAWERTGDGAYRDKALRVLESYGLERIRGGWMAMISAAFGVIDAMVEYTDLSRDPRFIPMIIDFAAMCMGPEIETNWTYPGGYFRIYAEALRYAWMEKQTAENAEEAQRVEEYRAGIERAIVKLHEQMAQSAPYLPEAQWPAPAGQTGGAFPNFSIDANTLRDLPFLMEALTITAEER